MAEVKLPQDIIDMLNKQAEAYRQHLDQRGDAAINELVDVWRAAREGVELYRRFLEPNNVNVVGLALIDGGKEREDEMIRIRDRNKRGPVES